MNKILDAAILYASLGWKVIPVGSPTMRGGGKTPIIKDWQNQASTDPQVISDWWKRYPEANVGVATGKTSGIVVIDLDLHHGADDSLFDLETQHGKLPDTTESMTGGGGRHLFFKYPQGVTIRNSVSKLGPGIDVRSDGGQVVLPPSIHKSGIAYEWEVSSPPWDLEPQPMAQWLVDLLAEPVQQTQQTKAKAVPDQVTKGQRNNLLTSLAGALRAKGIDPPEILVLLREVNQNRCVPPLQDDELDKIAKSIGRYAPKKTKVPTDDELADEWLQNHKDYCFGLGDWRQYSGGIWIVVDELEIQQDIMALMVKAKRKGFKPSSYRMRSVETFCRASAYVPDKLWNSDPGLLVCNNGTLEIMTKKLREHQKEDYLTSKVDYDYDPLAQCPTWDYFLATILDDVKDFLQEFAGYSLVTSCKHEVALWLSGPAGSGKSTFIEGLLAMLGAKVGILGLADIEQSSFALESLPDKTLLVSTEQPAKFVNSVHKVAAIISGEPIAVDRKYKRSIIVTPKAKIIWAMNELPRIPSRESGIFRRVKVVKFPPMPQGVADPNIKEAIKEEGAGVLAWALRGLFRLLQRDRFIIPKVVEVASEEFQKSSDIPALFVDEECETDPGYSVMSSVLYNRYKQWCIDNGHQAQSSTSLSQDWERLGFRKDRKTKGIYWAGVKIKSPPGVP